MIKITFLDRQIEEFSQYLLDNRIFKIESLLPKSILLMDLHDESEWGLLPFGFIIPYYELDEGQTEKEYMTNHIKDILKDDPADGFTRQLISTFIRIGGEALNTVGLNNYDVHYKPAKEGLTVSLEFPGGLSYEKTLTFRDVFKKPLMMKNQVLDRIYEQCARGVVAVYENIHEEMDIMKEVHTGIKNPESTQVDGKLNILTVSDGALRRAFIAHIKRSSDVKQINTMGTVLDVFVDFLGNEHLLSCDMKDASMDTLVERYTPADDIMDLAYSAFEAEVYSVILYVLEYATLEIKTFHPNGGTVDVHSGELQVNLPDMERRVFTGVSLEVDVNTKDAATIRSQILDIFVDNIMEEVTSGLYSVQGGTKALISIMASESAYVLRDPLSTLSEAADKVVVDIIEDDGLVLQVKVDDPEFVNRTDEGEQSFRLSTGTGAITSNVSHLVKLANIVGLSMVRDQMNILRDRHYMSTKKTKGPSESTVTAEQIEALMDSMEYDVHVAYYKVTIVTARLPKNGFTFVGSSACVHPANFDLEKGVEIAKKKIKDQLWLVEGYLLQNQLFNNEN